MKTVIKFIGTYLAATLLLGCASSRQVAAQDYPQQDDNQGYYAQDDQGDGYYQDDQGVSYQSFYDALSPYGQWMDYPGYGYVWLPDAGADFRPYYSGGHWVYTVYGWTWVSDYAWGWAPFHYGRWTYDDMYGWIWIPGRTWGPAWVAWRRSPDYYGWAPLGPRMSVGVSISFGSIAASWWSFVPCRYISSPRLSSYYVPYQRNVTIINNTTVINNTYVNNRNVYVSGPRASEVERYTHAPVRTFAVSNTSRPGYASVDNGQVRMYRPAVERTSVVGGRPAPARVMPYNNNNDQRGLNGRSFPQVNERNEVMTGNGNRPYRQQDSRSYRPQADPRIQQDNRRYQPQDNNPRYAPQPQNNEPRYSPQARDNRQYRPEPQNERQYRPQPQNNAPRYSPQSQDNRQYRPQPPQERPAREERAPQQSYRQVMQQPRQDNGQSRPQENGKNSDDRRFRDGN